MSRSSPFPPALALLLVALVGCASAPRVSTSIAVAPGARPAETILPTVVCRDVFLAEVRIDGRGPFTLLVDSGAPRTQLSRGVVRALGVRDHVRTIEIGDLSIRGRIPFDRRDLTMVGQALGTRLDGILGYPLFADLLLSFDLARGEVRVSEGSLDPGTPGTVAMSRGPRPYVAARLGERTIDLLVDTGFNGTLALAGLAGLPLEGTARPVGVRVRFDGPSVASGARVAGDLDLGAFTLRRPVVTDAVGRNLLGQRVLRHFVVTLDAASGLARFASPGGDPLEVIELPPRYGTGLALLPGPDGFAIFDVFAGSPAADAGLLPGDRVVAIDGVSIRARRGCSQRRDDGTDPPQRLTIERGGARFDVTIADGVLVD